MLMYYFPILDFPKAGANSFIVDDHIIFILVLLYFSAAKTGEYWGVGPALNKFLRRISSR